MTMASAAMQQQQQQTQQQLYQSLDSSHHSSAIVAPNHRHHLSMSSSAVVGPSSHYYPHHNHAEQQQQQQSQQPALRHYNHNQYQQTHFSSIYQENPAPRAISSTFNGVNQMEDHQNQSHNQQIQTNNENALELSNQANEAHFYYQQAANSIGSQEALLNHHHHHHNQHYYSESRAYSAAAVAAVAVPVVGYTTSSQLYNHNSIDHQYNTNNNNNNNSSSLTATSSGATPTSTPSSGTSSNQYPCVQLYNQTGVQDSPTMQQSYQSYNSQRQTKQLYHEQQQHQLRLNASNNQGRTVEGVQDNVRNKVELGEDSSNNTDESNNNHEGLGSNINLGETILTELGPKFLKSKSASGDSQVSQEQHIVSTIINLNDLEGEEEQVGEIDHHQHHHLNSKKRKRLSKVSTTASYATIKDEHRSQLGSAYEVGNHNHDQQQNEKSNDAYYEEQQRRIADRKVGHSLVNKDTLLSAFSIQTNQTSLSEVNSRCDQLEKYRNFPLAGSEQVRSQNNNQQQQHQTSHLNRTKVTSYQAVSELNQTNELQVLPEKQETADCGNSEFNQLRLIEMRKEKSRDAARSRRSKENHEFYELAKLLPLPAAITSQLDFLDKASIIRLTISFLKLRQFSVNGHPPWAPDFTTLGSVNPYSSQQSLSSFTNQFSGTNQSDDNRPQSRPTSVNIKQAQQDTPVSSTSSSTSVNQSYRPNTSSNAINEPTNVMGLSNDCRLSMPTQLQSSNVTPFADGPYQQPAGCVEKNSFIKNTSSLFDIHQGTHILQSIDGFAFAIGRDGRFLYISETVSMYLGLSQVEMTGSSVFDYAHQQDHEELARQLGIPFTSRDCNQEVNQANSCESPQPASVHSQYSAASNETLIDDHINSNCPKKRTKIQPTTSTRGAYGRNGKRAASLAKHPIKTETSTSDTIAAGLLKNATTVDNNDQTQLKNSPKDIQSIISNEVQGTDEDPLVRQFCIRMKSTLTKRGCQHFKSSGYRVVHVVAHLRSYQSNDHGHLMDPLDEAIIPSSSTKQTKRRAVKASGKDSSSSNKDSNNKDSNDNITSDGTTIDSDNHQDSVTKQKIIGMVAVAIALPPPSINELRLESGTFVLRLSLDLRVTHIEPKVTELLNYPVELVAGRSLYSIIHPADVYQVQKCHKDLLKKGQMMSGYYRLLARNGGYIWIQTCGTLICNNTFGNQAPILPNSPMPTPNSGTSLHEIHHKLPNYLAPTSLSGSDQLTTNIGSHSKVMSPGLSSHMSSNNENQDQDQCVIFVNYMITNIVESNEIVDICQSSDYTPTNSFVGSTNSNIMFNSLSPACSSPCLSSKTKTNSNCSGQFNSPSTPNNNSNLSSPSRRHHSQSNSNNNNNHNHNHNHHHHHHHHHNHHQHEDSKLRVDSKGLTNERRLNSLSSNKVKQHIYSSANSNSNENDHGGHNMDSQNNNNFNINQIGVNKVDNMSDHEPVGLESRSNIASSTSNAYGYPQTPGSVNLALNKQVHGTETSSWLTHHPSTTSRLGDTSIVYGTNQAAAASNHYETMNRSIYKAAFGLTDVGGTNYNHQQSAAVAAAAAVYPTAAVATNHVASSYPVTAGVTNTGWDTAAVAAVAAASNHLTNNNHHHHHHHNAHNPYAHLESHNHNHQAAAAAAAHSLGNNHHTSAAGTYYNYYGYYGNKFI